MKKRYLVLAAGMALSLGLATGCASKATEAETPAVEEEAAETEETLEEEVNGSEGALEEAGSEETEKENADGAENEDSEAESSNSESNEADLEGIPVSDTLRIWGAIEAVEDGMITVDNQSGLSSPGEMIFTIDPESTKILDAVSGLPVALEDIELGSFQAYLGPAMTMSLPPQTTPEMVIVNIPQDFQAPQYVTARGAIEETELGQTLMTVDGTAFVLTEETQILPHLTRNIVTAADIKEGSKCLFWQGEDGAVEKLVLFAE